MHQLIYKCHAWKEVALGIQAKLLHRQGGHMAQALAYLLVVCWQPAVKLSGEGRGGCIVVIPPAS